METLTLGSQMPAHAGSLRALCAQVPAGGGPWVRPVSPFLLGLLLILMHGSRHNVAKGGLSANGSAVMQIRVPGSQLYPVLWRHLLDTRSHRLGPSGPAGPTAPSGTILNRLLPAWNHASHPVLTDLSQHVTGIREVLRGLSCYFLPTSFAVS